MFRWSGFLWGMSRGWWTNINLRDHHFCWARDTIEDVFLTFICLYIKDSCCKVSWHYGTLQEARAWRVSWEELGFFRVSWWWLSNEGIGSTLMGDDSSSGFIFQFLSPRSSFRIRKGGEIRVMCAGDFVKVRETTLLMLWPRDPWATSDEVTSTVFPALQLWVISDEVTSATSLPFLPGVLWGEVTPPGTFLASCTWDCCICWLSQMQVPHSSLYMCFSVLSINKNNLRVGPLMNSGYIEIWWQSQVKSVNLESDLPGK